jgi:hypothetical protein
MTTTSSGTVLRKHERIAVSEAARGASLKSYERALAALFLVAIAVLVSAAWHSAFR